MDDFVAITSPWRIALIALGALTFVAGGLWMGGAFGLPPASSRYPPALIFVVGWFSVVFFGLCAVLCCRRLFDKREHLRVGPAGIRSAQWSAETIPWSEIVNVTTWSHRGQNVIILHLRNPDTFPGRGLPALLARANRKLTGGDVSISLVGTNRRFEEALSAIRRFWGADRHEHGASGRTCVRNRFRATSASRP